MLDFDWLFQNNNSKSLIGMLADHSNTRVYTRNSIKAFITLMWKEY